MSNLFSPYSLMILLPILLRIKKLSEKNVIGTQHQVYSYGLCPYTGPPFFLLLWMNILHSLKISAFSLMHLSMPSYLLNINIVEHLASWIFLFSPDKHTNYAIFPQLKKKKSYIDPTHSTGFIPSISAPLCRKTLQSISYHPTLKSILIAHLSWLLASFSTVSFTCFLSLALTCS